jgi:UDP-glucose-4-epimerase GalE
MRVLVVGGAGYIGSHTARILRSRGHEVLVYDNLSTGHVFLADGFELIQADFADLSRLTPALARVEAVMHFAASADAGESVRNPRKYFENNVRAALTFLNALIDSKIKHFVFSSTCAVYGVPSKVPITEDLPREPINPYGASKACFEYALQAYDQAYGLRFASLRYFNAAGADESGEIGELHIPENHLIPAALEAVAGMRPELQIFGDDYPTPDGTCIRDYIHVNDLGEAHALALEYLASQGSSIFLNLGTGRGSSVKEILSAVEKVSGPVPKRIVARRPGDPPMLVADPAKAEKILNWKARRSLEECVATAWKWMQRAQSLHGGTPLASKGSPR